MKKRINKKILKYTLWVLALLSFVIGLIMILVRLRRKRGIREALEERNSTILEAFPASLTGLTEAEAETRKLEGQDNVILFRPSRSPNDILRENTLTIFNLSLVGVAFVQFLLGLHWDMLLSLGIAVLNIGLNVFQEVYTLRRLKTLEEVTRPQATVIRSGKARSIDPSEIVQEDVLFVGSGDQILVDGEIMSEKPLLVDESILTGEGHRLLKHQGDSVLAGSFCISGRAAYQAQKVGEERLVAGLLKKNQPKLDERTPLERIVGNVLRVMLLVVAIMISLVLVHILKFDAAVGLDTNLIVSRVSVIFSLAPAGLYFMIFLNYIGSVRQLAKQGALVHRPRSVETLANATVLCVSLTGSRTGVGIQVEEVTSTEKNKVVPESRLRQILGDFGHTSYSNNQAVQALAELFPGDQRVNREQSPFLSAYGWTAIAFDENDLRGIYVLGDAHMLERYLIKPEGDQKENIAQKSQESKPRERFSILRAFRRRSEDPHNGNSKHEKPIAKQLSGHNIQSETIEVSLDKTSAMEDNQFRKYLKGIKQIFQRKQAEEINQEQKTHVEEIIQPIEEFVYLFAYYPEIVQLNDHAGQPQLPQGLIPLCYLHYSAQVNPETINTVRTLINSGVAPKVFSPGDPGRIANLLRQAGLGQEDSINHKLISGHELEGLNEDELLQAAKENTIFGHVTYKQTRQIVETLRRHGDIVVVFGSNPSDLPIMKNANLSITSQGSSQAALSTADIILLKESPQALLTIIEKGQSVLHSLLDVLRLYLTQLIYLTILIMALWVLGLGFPYLSQQGNFITIATLTIPSLALSLWETPGTLQRINLNRHLSWFVGPAALSISVTGLFLYSYFMKQSNQMAYAKLALTHMLVISGLVLLIFLRPPKITSPIKQNSIKDWRATLLALGLLITYLIIAAIPYTYKIFRLTLLAKPSDFLVVGLAVLTWSVIVQIIWKLIPSISVRMKRTQTPDKRN